MRSLTDSVSLLLSGGELLLPPAALALAALALGPDTARKRTPGFRVLLLAAAGCLVAAVVVGAWLARRL